jgi:hypothetical protein
MKKKKKKKMPEKEQKIENKTWHTARSNLQFLQLLWDLHLTLRRVDRYGKKKEEKKTQTKPNQTKSNQFKYGLPAWVIGSNGIFNASRVLVGSAGSGHQLKIAKTKQKQINTTTNNNKYNYNN